MGTECAPLLANLYLFHYEYLYMKNLIKGNFGIAKQFSHTVRYIDDLLTLNNPSFEAEIASIYPHELVLKKTTESRDRLSYLDYVQLLLKKNTVLRFMIREMTITFTLSISLLLAVIYSLNQHMAYTFHN